MLEPGQEAPDFEARDQHGNAVRLSDLRGKWVVLYFYPHDFTMVCTREACDFRDAWPDFAGLGAEVVGVSVQGERSHAAFAEKHALPFRLVADRDKSITDRYGGQRPLFGVSKRVTFVISPEGKVAGVHHREFGARSHVEFARRLLREAQQKG